MTLDEKAGQMFHAISIGVAGVHRETERQVTEGFISHFNVHQLPDARTAARWHNHMQELASHTRLGIPITVSTDPGMPSRKMRAPRLPPAFSRLGPSP